MPVTCSWMPLPPTGWPMPGVGGVTSAGATTGAAAAPSAVGWAAVVAAGADACGACAAAGVSPAAARAIAHPISFILTFEDQGWDQSLEWGRRREGPGFRRPYRLGFSRSQAAVRPYRPRC